MKKIIFFVILSLCVFSCSSEDEIPVPKYSFDNCEDNPIGNKENRSTVLFNCIVRGYCWNVVDDRYNRGYGHHYYFDKNSDECIIYYDDYNVENPYLRETTEKVEINYNENSGKLTKDSNNARLFSIVSITKDSIIAYRYVKNVPETIVLRPMTEKAYKEYTSELEQEKKEYEDFLKKISVDSSLYSLDENGDVIVANDNKANRTAELFKSVVCGHAWKIERKQYFIEKYKEWIGLSPSTHFYFANDSICFDYYKDNADAYYMTKCGYAIHYDENTGKITNKFNTIDNTFLSIISINKDNTITVFQKELNPAILTLRLIDDEVNNEINRRMSLLDEYRDEYRKVDKEYGIKWAEAVEKIDSEYKEGEEDWKKAFQEARQMFEEIYRKKLNEILDKIRNEDDAIHRLLGK
ncbi:MAG: hypothetical protein J5676_11410 [Bacteroidaceae bacterium]|nr:hypothetical protein [Bacteroidaceae bacterium]